MGRSGIDPYLSLREFRFGMTASDPRNEAITTSEGGKMHRRDLLPRPQWSAPFTLFDRRAIADAPLEGAPCVWW